jgi:hypothetical protein
LQTVLKEMAIPFEGRGGVDLWQGVAAKLVIGSLYYLRDGEVPQAMSRLGSNKRGQVLRIWTGPKLEGADDRLPLLTPNEKQRRVALRESPAASSTLGLGTTEDRPSRSGSNSSIELRDQRMDLLR